MATYVSEKFRLYYFCNKYCAAFSISIDYSLKAKTINTVAH